jgi:hypothetical protein
MSLVNVNDTVWVESNSGIEGVRTDVVRLGNTSYPNTYVYASKKNDWDYVSVEHTAFLTVDEVASDSYQYPDDRETFKVSGSLCSVIKGVARLTLRAETDENKGFSKESSRRHVSIVSSEVYVDTRNLKKIREQITALIEEAEAEGMEV